MLYCTENSFNIMSKDSVGSANDDFALEIQISCR